MKIAFVIHKKEDMQIGDCLSSAVLFEVYNELTDSFSVLEINQQSEHINLAKKMSKFLSENGIHYVVGKDLGPKAKAAIEEYGMKWFVAANTVDKKEIITLIKNKK